MVGAPAYELKILKKMKKKSTFKYLLGALLLGSVVTACDKFEDDVPPARMAALILNDDHYTTLKNHGLQLHVLANDSIGSTTTVQFAQPQNGLIQTDSSGAVYYQPAPNFIGTDVFTYKACLGSDCATANVTISVVQDTTNYCVTKAFDDTRNIFVGPAATWDTISVLRNDLLCGNTTTTINISQQPLHGMASVNPFNQIEYYGTTGYFGPDELTYTISNANGQATAKLKLNIQRSTQPCYTTARPDSVLTNRIPGTTLDSVSIRVATNDIICPNGGPVTITPVNPLPQYGTLNVAFSGVNTRFIYMTRQNSPATFNDSFQYRLCQGNNCSTTTVYIRRR